MQPRLDYVMCANPQGMHRMAYWEWGPSHGQDVVLCVHGLTRTGRDFDTLARQLAGRYRVVCPDVVGRGRSDWLPAGAVYGFPQYVADMLVLLARLQPRRLVWLGTSMGGLIALSLLAGIALSTRSHAPLGQGLPADSTLQLDGLILNDVGPEIDAAGLARIAEYTARPEQFASLDDATHYLQQISAGFGQHTPEQWAALAQHVFVKQPQGYVKHYDLRIAEGLQQAPDPRLAQLAQTMLWSAFDSFAAPILLLRGQESDILTAPQAQAMQARQAHMQLQEFAGVGHAPSLMADDQIQCVDTFVGACFDSGT